PHPCRKHHTTNRAFGASWRNIDDQIIQFRLSLKDSLRDNLEFVTQKLNMPVPNWLFWNDDLPESLHKLEKRLSIDGSFETLTGHRYWHQLFPGTFVRFLPE